MIPGDDCPVKVQIIGSGLICPGQDGFFLCATTNTSDLAWIVNNEPPILFTQSSVPGGFPHESNSGDAVAYFGGAK